MEAGCAVSSICADKEVEVDFDLGESLSHCFCTGVVSRASLEFEPGGVVIEIGPRKFVQEKEFDVGVCREFVQKTGVKARAIDCVNGLGTVINLFRT